MDQFRCAEDAAGRLCFKDATEQRFVKAELLLDHLGCQPHFPSDMALAGSNSAIDEGELDAIGIIKRKAVQIGLRKELAAYAGDPKILDRSCKVNWHRQSPSGSPKSA